MNKIVKFFHELMHPHCRECVVDAEVSKSDSQCKQCEVLGQQLLIANNEKRDLLNRLINPPSVEIFKEEVKEEEPITSRSPGLGWKVRKQLLEAEKRAEAQLIARTKATEDIEKLEEELGVKD